MDKQDIIYDLVKEIKADLKEDHAFLRADIGEIKSKTDANTELLATYNAVLINHLEEEEKSPLRHDISALKENVQNHGVLLDKYNELLRVHIEGVNTLKQLHLDNAKRINILEEPVVIKKAIQEHHEKIMKKVIKYTGLIATISTIAYTVLRLIK